MLTMLSVNQDNGERQLIDFTASLELGSATIKPGISPLSLSAPTGPHREMAVDVPESFIARNKTPPRYPPRPVQVSPLSVHLLLFHSTAFCASVHTVCFGIYAYTHSVSVQLVSFLSHAFN